MARVTKDALKYLEATGFHLVEVDFPSDFADDLIAACFHLVTFETHRLIPEYLWDQGAPVNVGELTEQIGDSTVKGLMENSGVISEERYHQCQSKVAVVCKQYDAYFKENNLEAFLCPTTITPSLKRPSPKKVEVAGHEFDTTIAYTFNTFPQAIVGVPCIFIPSGLTSDGLPVGLELVAPRDMDSNLLGLAASVQSVLPSLPQLAFSDFKDIL